TAIKAVRPGVRVVGVQTAVMPGIVASLRSGAPVAVEAARTVADGTAVAGPSALTFDLIQRHVDHVITVPEEAIARAIVLLIERSRLVVEGAGTLGVAAVMSGALAAVVPSPGKTALVLSGGNIDVTALGRIVARGLLLEGRQRTLTVAAANVPGELARITRAMAEAGANVIEVRHEIVTPDLPLGVARLTFRLEVTGAEAFEALLDMLEAHGLREGVATDLATPAAAAAAW
ncbi:MAG: threonine ammonia-lyase, partial [Chloroflexi bacterium HGW-Chloroflexi-9]